MNETTKVRLRELIKKNVPLTYIVSEIGLSPSEIVQWANETAVAGKNKKKSNQKFVNG